MSKDSDPVSPADTIRRLTEWVDDPLHAGRSVRSHEPTYRNPGELRRDVRALLAAGERDKAERERDRRKIAQLTEALDEARETLWGFDKEPVLAPDFSIEDWKHRLFLLRVKLDKLATDSCRSCWQGGHGR